MVKAREKNLEDKIIIDYNIQPKCWTEWLKSKEEYILDLTKGLMKYIYGVDKIKVGFFGFRRGKITKSLEEGYLTLGPTDPDEEIIVIEGIEKDKNIKNLSIGKAWIVFEYKNNQGIIIDFYHQ